MANHRQEESLDLAADEWQGQNCHKRCNADSRGADSSIRVRFQKCSLRRWAVMDILPRTGGRKRRDQPGSTHLLGKRNDSRNFPVSPFIGNLLWMLGTIRLMAVHFFLGLLQLRVFRLRFD